jgi:tape measure domain-containing protein
MATIQTAINMYDGMSPVIRSMSNALHILIDSFEDMQSTASNPINTSGIDSAVDNVKRVDDAIDKVDKNSASIDIDTSDIPPTLRQIEAVGNAVQNMGGNVKINLDAAKVKAIRDELTNIDAGWTSIGENIKRNTDEQKKHNKAIDTASDSARTLKSIMATIGVGMGIKGVLNLSDSLSQTTARLNMIVDKESNINELQEKIFASAQRSRGSYLDMADTVAKLSQRTGDLFSNDEAVLFAENLNKAFVVAGAEQESIRSATLQLNQAMGSGVLRGEELNAIYESAPNLIQTIADYIEENEQVARQMADAVGVSYESMSSDAMLHIRSLAEEGQLTSGLIKNAMLGATDAINKEFEKMPYTWSQVMTSVQNVLLKAFQPLLNLIGSAADFIGKNWSTIEPIFWGVATAVGGLVGALLIYNTVQAISNGIKAISAAASAIHGGASIAEAAATTTATGAQVGFNAALLACPFTWILIGVMAFIGVVVALINKVGGLKVAWLMTVNAVLTALDALKIGFFTGVFFVQNLFDKLSFAMMSAGTNIANFMGDMKVNVLTILQNMINGAIDIINKFISVINSVTGASIGMVEHVTFATTAKIENDAAKNARNEDLANYRKEIEANAADRDAKLNQMQADARNDAAERQAKIDAAKKASADKNSNNGVENLLEGINTNTTDTASNTAAMSDSMGGLEDSLEYMVDVAEREVINRFTTAEISVTQTNNNNINSNMDIDGVMDRWNSDFTEILDTAAEGVHQ